jgi:nucleolar protein 15
MSDSEVEPYVSDIEQENQVEEDPKSSPEKDASILRNKAGVIYIGHLPFGFFEDQLWNYFAQFGQVSRVKVSRNPRTGKSRHYAFVQFKVADVADIAAQAMNGYMMFGKTLEVHTIAPEKVHDRMFLGPGNLKRAPKLPKGTVRPQISITAIKYRKKNKIEEKTESKPRSAEAKKEAAIKKEQARLKKLQNLGIDYKPPFVDALEQ